MWALAEFWVWVACSTAHGEEDEYHNFQCALHDQWVGDWSHINILLLPNASLVINQSIMFNCSLNNINDTYLMKCPYRDGACNLKVRPRVWVLDQEVH